MPDIKESHLMKFKNKTYFLTQNEFLFNQVYDIVMFEKRILSGT